jgi:hypothetical protein
MAGPGPLTDVSEREGRSVSGKVDVGLSSQGKIEGIGIPGLVMSCGCKILSDSSPTLPHQNFLLKFTELI